MTCRLRIFFSLLSIVFLTSGLFGADFYTGKILVQFRGLPEEWYTLKNLTSTDQEIQFLIHSLNIQEAEQCYPIALPPEEAGGIELRTWWEFSFPSTLDVLQVQYEFEKCKSVLFAQPKYIYTIDLQYNDPRFNQQWGLTRVNSNLAHDYSTGDPSVIVAIVDTGVQLTHPDLSPNLWVNPGEDLNGNGVIETNERNNIDDDMDGFVDNFHGADVVDNDGDPSPNPTNSSHGTHCAGIASAKTNNATGIASLGYNCKIMAVRAGAQQYITDGYDGIVFAANKLADVISLSWGGNSAGPNEQQVINYAWARNCVILAAAGNDNVSTLHYPSALNNVVAVASTSSNDQKSSFSNYGTWVDICAPGSNIMSTVPTNSYTYMSGTSMACPFAAGLAALIKSRILSASNQEVVHVLLSSADNIDAINPNYVGLLGAGRINALAAMEMLNVPNITLTNYIIEDQGDEDGRLEPGENGLLSLYIHAEAGYADADSCWITVTPLDANVTVNPSTRIVGTLNAGSSWNNENTPFSLFVAANSPQRNVTFRVQIFAQPGDYAYETHFTYFVGWPEVLLVDDDEGSNFESFYRNALSNMNRTFEYFDMYSTGSLPQGFMEQFQWVIWYTGNATSTIDAYDQMMITNYLNNGGKILISSQNLPEDLQAQNFMSQIVGAEVLQTSALQWTIEPVTNAPFGVGRLYLTGSQGAGNGRFSQSTMTPSPGTGVAYTLGSTSEACGVYRQIGNGKLVLFSVALEAISSTAQTVGLMELLTSISNYFSAPSSTKEPYITIPTTCLVSDIYPNPFNSTASFTVQTPNKDDIHLSIFDITGRLVSSNTYHISSSGEYKIEVNLTNFSSGIYLFHITSRSGFTTTRKALYLR
ncbi:MAG: S8 family serine peptidase [bacterium]|nr:S8 family serine peptidase [bacterium]